MPPPRKKLKSPVENQRKITFFLGQTDESNQDSTEHIATTGNSDNTSDTPVELRNFRAVGALSSPGLHTSLRKIKCFASQPLFLFSLR